jgi:hypothetical protein
MHHASQPPADACWLTNAPIDYIVRDAANFLVSRKGTDADRARSLAAVPLVVDSVRMHSRVVNDRSAGGLRAFDDSYHLLAAFADL